ncbi:MAG: ArsR family transcriptional regulator [Halobellus sp.]|uniref:ArsR family transcriptional regulator n=1 Tax=Halobellus sp. TaxID=1979212 RepID=UPI0035D4FA42
MDSAVLLDLLGNENRRRILRLLSHKPCYVTEISEYLGVSPKAVIDHLRRLEEAGLVESRTDEKRRKYFHIARNLRLEVSVSPYRFGAKSAYPASRSLDMRGRCQHISVDLPGEPAEDSQGDGDDGNDDATERGETGAGSTRRPRSLPDDTEGPAPRPDGDRAQRSSIRRSDDVAALARQYAYLDDVESELSLAQRWVHGRVTDVLDELSERLGSEIDSRFHAEVLAALARDTRTVAEIARTLNTERERVERALELLDDRGLVAHDGTEWRIV